MRIEVTTPRSSALSMEFWATLAGMVFAWAGFLAYASTDSVRMASLICGCALPALFTICRTVLKARCCALHHPEPEAPSHDHEPRHPD